MLCSLEDKNVGSGSSNNRWDRMKKWGWCLMIVWLLLSSVAYAEQEQQSQNDLANRILSGLEENQKGTFIIKESSSLENDAFLDWLEKKTEVIRLWLTELSVKLSVKFLLMAGPFLILGSVLLFFMGLKKSWHGSGHLLALLDSACF